MNLSAFDWPSFLLGLLAAGVVLFLQSLVRAAAGDSWTWLKNKFFPAPPEPMLVDGRFEPELADSATFDWVREARIYAYEQKGYAHYAHPPRGARCYREVTDGSAQWKEFLMIKQDGPS